MSKRVIISLVVALVALVAAFLFFRLDLSKEPGEYHDEDNDVVDLPDQDRGPDQTSEQTTTDMQGSNTTEKDE